MNKISVKESWKFGWVAFKRNWQILIYATAIPFLIGIILDNMFNVDKTGAIPESLQAFVLVAALFVLKYLVKTLFSIGQTRINIDSDFGGEENKPKYSDLFNSQGVYLKFLAASVLYTLAVLGCFLLLIIPGIYIALRYCFAPILVIDKKMNIGEAFLKSKEMTKGIKWQLLGFFFVSIIFVLLGLIGLGVGIIVTYIVFQLAYIHLYRKLLDGSDLKESGGQMDFQDIQVENS